MLKLVYRNKKTGALCYEAWYSLELKQLVKSRENLASGLACANSSRFSFDRCRLTPGLTPLGLTLP